MTSLDRRVARKRKISLKNVGLRVVPLFRRTFVVGGKKISEKLWEYTHFVHLATRVLHGALTSFFFFFFSPIYFTGATDCADK